jgi:low temperature requirement protein LtrA
MASANQSPAETAPGTQRSPARPIIESPRFRSGEGAERKATWLEFFFDLVFAAAVGQVARRLAGPLTSGAALEFAVLAAPVWWAWVGYVYYKDRFGTDDLSDRLLTLAQMGAALALAARAHDALEEGAVAFSAAYAAFRLILTVRYMLAAMHDDEGHRLAMPFAIGYGLAALLWLASAAVASPARFALWGAGFLVDVATPIAARRLNVEFPLNSAHLQERFGEFTLIVLGVGITGVVEGLRDLDWAPGASLTAALALVAAFTLWWVYFEALEGAPIDAARRGRSGVYLTWVYAHLPLALGIAAAAMGAEHAIRSADLPALPDSSRWLYTGSVALSYAAIGVIALADAAARGDRWRRLQALSCLGVSVVVLAIGAFADTLSAAAVFGLRALAGAAPIAIDLGHRSLVRRRLQRRDGATDSAPPGRGRSGS